MPAVKRSVMLTRLLERSASETNNVRAAKITLYAVQ